MTQNDILYRAFGDLIKELGENRALVSTAEAVAKAREHDIVTVAHNVCHVETDWIVAIERGLEYIGKAIEEDRQFIRSNGEVQPIEKVRHISRESVQHLSRHSDLISREQTNDDLIPDKLYTVERLNDYTVYENRFLYLLLLRIRDFVAYRYDAIMGAYKMYRGELVSKKRVVTATRRLTYEFTLTDEQNDVFGATADAECAAYLDRIRKIQSSVAFYLRTPLMTEVARVDKIKSKITKTNVLRMDKNFREAVSLYEFLLAYTKDGFTVERAVEKLDPVSKAVAQELAYPVILSSFLVYEHGLGIEASLQEEYEREEARRAEEAQLALVEAIRELKKRIEETGEGVEEYMLKLEERNAVLEQNIPLLAEARAEIESLRGTIEELHLREEQLKEQIGELEAANAALAEEKERAEEEHARRIEQLRAEHAEEMQRAEEAHQEALSQAKKRAAEETARVRAEGEARLKEERRKLAEKDRENAEVRNALAEKGQELAFSEKERELYHAQLTAVRRERGLVGAEDYTTEAGFNALEHDFEVLGVLVRDKWTDVKKILYKEFMGGIRATMRGKKPQKSDRYRQMSAEAKARRARTGSGVPNETDGSGTDGKKN